MRGVASDILGGLGVGFWLVCQEDGGGIRRYCELVALLF